MPDQSGSESAGFICLCTQKSVEFGQDKHFHRNTHDQELHDELCLGDKPKLPKEFLYLPGGAVCAINPSWYLSTGQHGTMMGVFFGFLSNYASLVKQHWSAQLGLDVSKTPLEKIDALHPVKEAELVCWMFAELGPNLLTKLQGNYAFCLYDSKLVRVLAARDPSGRIPLLEGRSEHDNLVIISGPFRPPNITIVTEIAPGNYKYGWHAAPRAYPVDAASPTRKPAAQQLHPGRHHQLPRIPENGQVGGGRRRHSLDMTGSPQADGRRGADSGRRHSLDGQRPQQAGQQQQPRRSASAERASHDEAAAEEGAAGEEHAAGKGRKRGGRHHHRKGHGHGKEGPHSEGEVEQQNGASEEQVGEGAAKGAHHEGSGRGGRHRAGRRRSLNIERKAQEGGLAAEGSVASVGSVEGSVDGSAEGSVEGSMDGEDGSHTPGRRSGRGRGARRQQRKQQEAGAQGEGAAGAGQEVSAQQEGMAAPASAAEATQKVAEAVKKADGQAAVEQVAVQDCKAAVAASVSGAAAALAKVSL